MSAKNWCFTINNPTAGRLEILCNAVKDIEHCNYLVFQEERGENRETIHYQGYVQFTSRKTLATVKRLLAPEGHFEVAKGSPAQNKEYCTKSDTRISGPFEYGSMRGGSGTRNDLVDFVSASQSARLSERELIEQFAAVVARYPRFVDRVRRLYSAPAPIEFVPRPGWQLDLSLVLNGQADPRKVLWYYEEVGNVGKSFFALNFSTRGRRGYVVTGGRFSDIYYAYDDEPVVFFDWARDQEESFPYKVVESFKNGYFLNTKYESCARRFPTPHVVVFANFGPDRSKLSNDRWEIKEI